jgi:hypothetical protein
MRQEVSAVSNELKGLYKLGGAGFIVSGVLFLSRDILELMAGPPPSGGVEILGWVDSGKLALSLVSEVLFFAVVALVPAVIALYRSLASTERAKAATGCGIIAAVIPVIVMLLIVHGRLVYPVYGIRVSSPDVAANIVAVFYGGMHAVDEMMGIATFVLSLAMMRGVYGKRIAFLGIATGVLDFIGAFPWAIGSTLTLVCQVFFAAWFVAVGLKLYGMRELADTGHSDLRASRPVA